MTQVINGVLIIQSEQDDICEYCGRVAELRPYGANGERICFTCGMKNEATTRKQFMKLLDQVTPIKH